MDNFDVYQMMQEEARIEGEIIELPLSVLGDLDSVNERGDVDALSEPEADISTVLLGTKPRGTELIADIADRPPFVSGIEEEIIDDVELVEEFDLFRGGQHLIVCCVVAIVMTAFITFTCLFMLKRKEQKRRVAVDRPWSLKEFQFHMTEGLMSNSEGMSLPCLSIWEDDAFALKLMSRLAEASRDAAVMLTTSPMHAHSTAAEVEVNHHENHADSWRESVACSRALRDGVTAAQRVFDVVFAEGEDDYDLHSSSAPVSSLKSRALHGRVPRSTEEELFHVNCLLQSARSRLVMRLADDICRNFQTVISTILDNLTTAVALENVGDSLFGTVLCRAFDEHYSHFSSLQSTKAFQQAASFLEQSRAGKERKALEFENGLTEKILSQYQQSCAILSSSAQSCVLSSTQIEGGTRALMSSNRNSRHSDERFETEGGEVLHRTVACSDVSSSLATSSAGAAPDGVDVTHQLSVMHHYHSIRENSNRALMMSLQAISAADEQTKEEAGRRAASFLQQFKTQMQFDFKFQEAQSALQHEKVILLEKQASLEERRRQEKVRQNMFYKWFSYLLLVCGIFCFLNGALELHISDTPSAALSGGERAWSPFSHADISIIEWLFFQTRMICVYLNDATQDCAEAQTCPDGDEPHSRAAPWALFTSVLTERLPFVAFLPQMVSFVRSGVWSWLAGLLSQSLHADPAWLLNVVLPCLSTLVWRLLPVWFLAFILKLFGCSHSIRTLVSTSCSVYVLRRPLGLFLQRFRLFGLLLLFPLCLQVFLELLDHRVEWCLYWERRRRMPEGSSACQGSGVTNNGACGLLRNNITSLDMRWWILYVVFPACYLLAAWVLGRQY